MRGASSFSLPLGSPPNAFGKVKPVQGLIESMGRGIFHKMAGDISRRRQGKILGVGVGLCIERGKRKLRKRERSKQTTNKHISA
jgi:hypothetical protein